MSPQAIAWQGVTPQTGSCGVPIPPGRNGHSEILLPVNVEELLLRLQDHLKAWQHCEVDTRWTQDTPGQAQGTRVSGDAHPSLPYSLTSNWVLKTCSGESSNLAIMVHVPMLEKKGDKVRGQAWGHRCPQTTLGGGTYLTISGR